MLTGLITHPMLEPYLIWRWGIFAGVHSIFFQLWPSLYHLRFSHPEFPPSFYSWIERLKSSVSSFEHHFFLHVAYSKHRKDLLCPVKEVSNRDYKTFRHWTILFSKGQLLCWNPTVKVILTIVKGPRSHIPRLATLQIEVLPFEHWNKQLSFGK